jgi:hypothetical protein
MMRRRPLLSLIALLFVASIASADVRMVATQPGPNRLDPDVGLLAHAREHLGDLRFVDASGREVPYLLIAPSREPQWNHARLLPIVATKKTSGFEADLGEMHTIDRIRFAGIATPFLKRARLEGSGDRSRWTLLTADATVFDLPDDKLRNLEIAFEPGDFRYLRVTWDDRNSAVVKSVGDISARLHTSATPPEVRVPLAFRKIASEPRKSRYRITLPGRHMPIQAIEVAVTNADVWRAADVFEQQLFGAKIVPQLIGNATLKRAERFGGVASDLAIPIERPKDVDLELGVEDGDNPTLAISSINAKLAPLPWIWLESDGSPLKARYGDARLEPPHYDIEASRNAIAKTSPPLAKWSNDEAPPAGPDAATTALAAFRGASVNRHDYRYARPLPPAPAGVARLALDADVLARSRDVADVRLVDASDRQVPYIVESVPAPLTIPLAVPLRVADGSNSKYTIELPYDRLPEATRLVLTTSARVFDRCTSLSATPDDRHGRATPIVDCEQWQSTEPSVAAPQLAFDAARARTKKVDVAIVEGDNAPLPITSVHLEMPAVALRFYNSGAPLTLLYGSASAQTPRYDLALLAPRVLGEPARDIVLGAIKSAGAKEGSLDVKIFWGALSVATIALLVVLGRLVKSPAA